MGATLLLKPPVQANVVEKVRAAYLDQPTLNLTIPQAHRLFDLEVETVEAVMHALVDAHFLRPSDEVFVRTE